MAHGNLAGEDQIWDSDTDRWVSVLEQASWPCVCVRVRVRAPTALRPQRGSSARLPAAPLPGRMFPNSLHKILLMPGFLAADTVRALFPLPQPCQREALGLSSERQTAQWLPAGLDLTGERSTPGTAPTSAGPRAQ